jgi:hypothetical protein
MTYKSEGDAVPDDSYGPRRLVVYRSGKVIGVYSPSEIPELLSKGEIRLSDLYREQAMSRKVGWSASGGQLKSVCQLLVEQPWGQVDFSVEKRMPIKRRGCMLIIIGLPVALSILYSLTGN